MKQKRILIAFIITLLIMTLAGCGPAKSITTGAFDGATYSNDFFNMSFTVPADWTISSKEEMKQIFQAGVDEIGSDDKETEKKLKLAEAKTLYLAYASKHPLDYAEGFNPNLNVVCENLSLTSLVIKTSSDYAEAALKNMQSTMDGYTFSDIQTKTISGAEFAIVDAVLDYSGVEIRQQLVSTLKNNYAILFTLTYLEDTELDELQAIMDSISFGK